MKALVTGASGQLGRALQRGCPGGVDLVALGSDKLDITDPGQIERAVAGLRPDVILNAAAFTAVDTAQEQPERAQAINDSGVRLLADAAHALGARLVHVSTDYVFDGQATQPYPPGAAPRPLNTYGRTKLAGEGHLAANDILVRTAWVHGAPQGTFVVAMLKLMRDRHALDIVADQSSTPTRVTSLAAALWHLVRGDHAGSYHFTDSGSASRYDFAKAIMEEALDLGLLARPVALNPVPASQFPSAALRPAYSVLDSSETYAALGWTPPHWRENLRRELAAVAAHG